MSYDNPQAGQGRPLPKKETDLFKNVVKFYENKNYKKGMKSADQILKRFPNHGETLCMKGLILNGMATARGGGVESKDKREEAEEKKKEAVELVKRGLMMDMR
jgi:peptide alpha-N-acetyltransferase